MNDIACDPKPWRRIIFVYITCSGEKEAEKIAETLLDKNLIACANVFPIKSIYRWNRKVTKNNEVVLILKTLPENFDKVVIEIKKMHSYKLPCITKIEAQSEPKFFEWLKKECKR